MVHGEGGVLLLRGWILEVHLSLQNRATCKLKFVPMETPIFYYKGLNKGRVSG